MRGGKNETEDLDGVGGGLERAVARRNLLKFGGIAAAGAAVAVVASAVDMSPAGATTGNMQFGAANDAGSVETDLTSSASSQTLGVVNSGTGHAMLVQSTDPSNTASAIQATVTDAGSSASVLTIDAFGLGASMWVAQHNANASNAVHIDHLGSQDGVLATANNSWSAIAASNAGAGTGIRGSSAGGDGVSGSAGGAHNGVIGSCLSGTGAGAGVAGLSLGGAAPAVRGVTEFGSTAAAIVAQSGAAGAGVDTTSATGMAINAHKDSTTDTADAVKVNHAGKGRGLNVNTSNVANAADAVTVTQHGTGRGVNVVSTGTGTAVAASAAGSATALAANSATGTAITAIAGPTTQAVMVALSTGAGSAFVAATGAAGTHPTVQSSSGSAFPAVQTTGKVVAANGGTVPIAGNGAALNVQGVASFTRSGVKTLGAAATSVVVQVPGGLTAASHVLATVQTNTGTIAVRAAVPNTANGSVTIYFTANAPIGTTVGWFVFG